MSHVCRIISIWWYGFATCLIMWSGKRVIRLWWRTILCVNFLRGGRNVADLIIHRYLWNTQCICFFKFCSSYELPLSHSYIDTPTLVFYHSIQCQRFPPGTGPGHDLCSTSLVLDLTWEDPKLFLNSPARLQLSLTQCRFSLSLVVLGPILLVHLAIWQYHNHGIEWFWSDYFSTS